MTTFPEAAELQVHLIRWNGTNRIEPETRQALIDLLEVVKRIDFYTTQPEQPEHPELPL